MEVDSEQEQCVVGVDPGSHFVGLAVVTDKMRLAFSNVVTADGLDPKQRVLAIYRCVRRLVHEYHPAYVVVEQTKSAVHNERVEFMNWVVGALFLLEDMRVHGAVSPRIYQYDPIEVARSFLADDRIGKLHIRKAVEQILGCKFDTPILKRGRTGGHDSDAAAVALYHLIKEQQHGNEYSVC